MGLAMLLPLETVSSNFDYIGLNASIARRIHDLLAEQELADQAAPMKLSDHTITFDHVTFSYGEGKPALMMFPSLSRIDQ